MPRKKASDTGFTWKGKPVSKTTYFRRKAEQKMMGVSEEDVVRLPKPGVLQALSEPPTPTEQTTTESVATAGERVDDALLRDFMTLAHVTKVNLYSTVPVSPRVYIAIRRALEKAGY